MFRLASLARQTIPSLRSSAVNRSNFTSVDRAEVSKFSAQAAKWWDPDGAAGPLHRMNPTRIAYIRSAIERHITDKRAQQTSRRSVKPLHGVDIVDVGCGGGLVTEPMARLGANVLGIDMARESVQVARLHAERDQYLRSSGHLEYQEAAVEDLVASSANFDVVLALEVIEHVANPTSFVRDCAALVREGGVLVVSTLNRTVASYALGIVAAERVLGWLPRGTHDWTKFPRPEEVANVIHAETNLRADEVVGVAFRPLSGTFAVVEDTSVNYILTAFRPHPPAVEPTASSTIHSSTTTSPTTTPSTTAPLTVTPVSPSAA